MHLARIEATASVERKTEVARQGNAHLPEAEPAGLKIDRVAEQRVVVGCQIELARAVGGFP